MDMGRRAKGACGKGMTFNDFAELARMSFRDTKQALRMLQSLDLSMEVRWLALFLAVTLATALAVISASFFPIEVEGGVIGLTRRPFILAAVQLMSMVMASWLLAYVGRLFGGYGTFADALLIVGWVALLLAAAQAVQVLLMLIFPLFAAVAGLAAIAAFVYLIVQFAKALHGFQSTIAVILGMFATVIAASFVLSIIMQMLGVIPPGVSAHEL